ncbi:hypothetical protein SALB1_0888 [Salinisphaera sp. LB1]|nr:hypothetical protein SALB1_0888 [Salinisphaera sp. LB1]
MTSFAAPARRFATLSFAMGALPERRDDSRDRSHYRAMIYLREGGQQYAWSGTPGRS